MGFSVLIYTDEIVIVWIYTCIIPIKLSLFAYLFVLLFCLVTACFGWELNLVKDPFQ